MHSLVPWAIRLPPVIWVVTSLIPGLASNIFAGPVLGDVSFVECLKTGNMKNLFVPGVFEERTDANVSAPEIPHDIVVLVVLWIGKSIDKNYIGRPHQHTRLQHLSRVHTFKLLPSGLGLQVLLVAAVRDVGGPLLYRTEGIDFEGLHELHRGVIILVFVSSVFDGPGRFGIREVAGVSSPLVPRRHRPRRRKRSIDLGDW